MLFFLKKGKNAAKTCKNLCEVYGDNAVGESTVRWWFGRFRTGNFNLEDKHRSGKPSKLDNDVLATKIKDQTLQPENLQKSWIFQKVQFTNTSITGIHFPL